MELPRRIEPGPERHLSENHIQPPVKSDAQLMLENIVQSTSQSLEQRSAKSSHASPSNAQDAKPRLMLMGLRR